MNFKTTYLLFAALAVMLVLFGLTLWVGPGPGADSAYVLPGPHDSRNPVRADDIDLVEIERAGPPAEKLVFARDREQKSWRMTEPHPFHVDTSLVNSLVSQVLDARRDEKVDLGSDLSRLGLDAPNTMVTLKKGDDRQWKLNLGSERPGTTTAVVYVTSSERPREPMAVKRSELDNLFKKINDFRSRVLLADSAFDIQAVDVKDGKRELSLQKNDVGRWRIQQPPYGDADYEGDTTAPTLDKGPKTINGVRSLLDILAALKVGSTDDFIANDVSDLAKYGLEEGKHEGPRIEVKRNASGFGADKKTITETLLIGKKEEKGDKVYARLADEKHVVRIDPKDLDAVTKVLDNPGILRDRDLAHFEEFRTDAIDIQNAHGLLKLRKPATGGWKLSFGSESWTADDSAVKSLLSALAAKRQIKEFPDPKSKDADIGLDKPAAVVSLWVDGIDKDEKKEETKDEKKDGDKDGNKEAKKGEKKDAEPKLKNKDKPTLKLTFGKTEKGVVYVRREANDETLLVTVPESLLNDAIRGPLAYRSRELPAVLRDGEATKVTIVRGSDVFEVEKEKKDDKDVWMLKQPKDLAGRFANAGNVENILGDLRFMTPQKWVAEKPPDADLDKYGLKSPQVKVTVTVKDKEGKAEDHVYLFGKESEDKLGRYAMLGKGSLVFLVQPQVVSAIQNELVDPVVLRFDAARIKELKLTGWEKKYSFQVTLDVERKPDGSKAWVVKAGPTGFDLDEKKVETFVTGLAYLKAERFVTFKSGSKPEQKLGKDRALEIELTLETQKEPIKLTIGDLDAKDKKAYFAQSSTLPGDVFLVAQERFQKLLDDGAGYFSKKNEAAK